MKWTSIAVLTLGACCLRPHVQEPSVSRSYPVCSYTWHESHVERIQATKQMIAAIASTFDSRLTVSVIGNGQSVVVKGAVADIDSLTKMWPDFGCVGQPMTPSEVVGRDWCRADMARRVDKQAPQPPNAMGEGKYYLCAHPE